MAPGLHRGDGVWPYAFVVKPKLDKNPQYILRIHQQGRYHQKREYIMSINIRKIFGQRSANNNQPELSEAEKFEKAAEYFASTAFLQGKACVMKLGVTKEQIMDAYGDRKEALNALFAEYDNNSRGCMPMAVLTTCGIAMLALPILFSPAPPAGPGAGLAGDLSDASQMLLNVGIVGSAVGFLVSVFRQLETISNCQGILDSVKSTTENKMERNALIQDAIREMKRSPL